MAKFLGSEKNLWTKSVKYEDKFGSLEEQREVVGVLARLLGVREEQLERRSGQQHWT